MTKSYNLETAKMSEDDIDFDGFSTFGSDEFPSSGSAGANPAAGFPKTQQGGSRPPINILP